MNIITGEKIQYLADIYIGYENDLNARIVQKDPHKFINIYSIPLIFNNPKNIFCYSYCIYDFKKIIDRFQNPFILITHNSDENIINHPDIIFILNHPLLMKCYSQNVCFYHPKLFMIPIGIANSQWAHGDLTLYNNQSFMTSCKNKTKNVYFFFNIGTNLSKREPCYQALKDKLEWLHEVSPNENLIRLSQYKFCICPEGNGVDTHRLWEALYLKCIPIVIKSPFTETLQRHNIPLIVLDKWEDFDEGSLIYREPIIQFDFSI
jgi:hypothetical protein